MESSRAIGKDLSALARDVTSPKAPPKNLGKRRWGWGPGPRSAMLDLNLLIGPLLELELE
jgi:hypothetical protein